MLGGCMDSKTTKTSSGWVTFYYPRIMSEPISVLYMAVSDYGPWDPLEIEIPYMTTGITYIEKCHGCEGKGWVPIDGKPVRCIICNGSGKKENKKEEVDEGHIYLKKENDAKKD